MDNTRYYNIFECIYHIMVYRDIFLQCRDIVIQKISYRGITTDITPAADTSSGSPTPTPSSPSATKTPFDTTRTTRSGHHVHWPKRFTHCQPFT